MLDSLSLSLCKIKLSIRSLNMKWMRFKLFGCLFFATILAACNTSSGSKGHNSYKNVYDAYCEKHPEYKGDIYQWLDDLGNGVLFTSTDPKDEDLYKNIFDVYCEKHPEYKGDINQWLDDMLNGRLADKIYHTVTFETFGYSTVPEQKVLHGEKVEKPTLQIPNDIDFSGWLYIDKDSLEDYELEEVEQEIENGYTWVIETYGSKWYFGLYTIEKDITLYGRFETKPSPVTSNYPSWYGQLN